MTITPEFMCTRWNGAERPLFKGSLIDDDGCCCAQGDVLRVAGWDDDRLRAVDQHEADKAVAKELGISVTHSVLLRQVNDSADGCPQLVLSNPAAVLGDQADKVLAFWKRLDAMSDDDWGKVIAAGNAARYAAGVAAGNAARYAAGVAAGDAARNAARYAAGYATNEIQGAAVMRERGQPFVFLPMFGINDPEELGDDA